jgi:RNA polymerase sigma factor (sigma-70 family)
MPCAETFRFTKRSQSLFDEWVQSNTASTLAALLAEMQDTLGSHINGYFRGLKWSLAQTFSDAFQDLQGKALAARWQAASFPRIGSLAAYALVIIRHHIIDRARRLRPVESLEAALNVYADCRQPSDSLEARETAAIVRLSVDSLEPDWRDAIRMKYLDGYTNDAVARVLDRSPDAVRMLILRARRALADLLATEQGTVS